MSRAPEVTRWEAFGGMMPTVCGKRRNGKDHVVLAVQIIVVMTEADAKAMSKKHPQLKFRRKGRSAPTKSQAK